MIQKFPSLLRECVDVLQLIIYCCSLGSHTHEQLLVIDTFGLNPIEHLHFKNAILMVFRDLVAFLHGPSGYNIRDSVEFLEYILKFKVVHDSVVVCII